MQLVIHCLSVKHQFLLGLCPDLLSRTHDEPKPQPVFQSMDIDLALVKGRAPNLSLTFPSLRWEEKLG